MYPEWYFMNIAKRQKNNNLENVVTFGPLSMVNGLFLPYLSIGMMSTYVIGRNFYNQGYVEKEGAMNTQRMAGAAMCHTATCVTVISSLFIGI